MQFKKRSWRQLSAKKKAQICGLHKFSLPLLREPSSLGGIQRQWVVGVRVSLLMTLARLSAYQPRTSWEHRAMDWNNCAAVGFILITKLVSLKPSLPIAELSLGFEQMLFFTFCLGGWSRWWKPCPGTAVCERHSLPKPSPREGGSGCRFSTTEIYRCLRKY